MEQLKILVLSLSGFVRFSNNDERIQQSTKIALKTAQNRMIKGQA